MSFDDDPFSCFGEDSDSEHDQESLRVLNSESEEARKNLLVHQANERMVANLTIVSENHTSEGKRQHTDTSSSSSSCKDLPPPVILPFSPALYMGPIRIVESTDVGGHRGYIATEDLKPGTLLLVEKPLFEWPEEQLGKELGLFSVQALLRCDCAIEILKDMEQLYPTKEKLDNFVRNHGRENQPCVKDLLMDEKIQIVDMVELMELQLKGSKEMEATLALVKQRRISIDEIDVCRILLVMRYNGFGSGVYLHFSMFNHDLDANCIKFQPENPSGSDGKDRYSEVRTTKFVKRGHPLSLDYLDPREQSHATRRRYLWDQHRFDIGSEESIKDSNLRQLYLVNGTFPPSSVDSRDFHDQTYHIESALKELEEQMLELKSSWNFMSSSSLHESVQDMDIQKLFEHVSVLGEASLECISAAEEKLGNPNHILLIRCNQLYLNSAEIILQLGFEYGPTCLSSMFRSDDAQSVMGNFVVICHNLLPLQKRFLGNDHPDIARTNHDLTIMINSMLSRCPKVLYGTNIEEYSTFGKCQVMEAKYMKEFRRIDALYPKDTELRIGEYQNGIAKTVTV
mmetsp:Transcript_4244/g.8121  ORF Transcript_4244/g.8121 Transcript_4244/m.8121 type:complete len:569 (+) Transcript_4244:120-1826(+)